MTEPRSLLVATTNPGKLREVRDVLATLPLRLLCLADLAPVPEPPEEGPTFEEIAIHKASYYASTTGCLTLADDSGLEVDALGVAPGVHSARYAGQPRDDAANNRKLIAALADVPLAQRTARFRCAVALADSKSLIGTASGFVDGIIVDKPVGSNGFGYDPHFYVPALGCTTAQMPPALKNSISHRGKALRNILPLLEQFLSHSD